MSLFKPGCKQYGCVSETPSKKEAQTAKNGNGTRTWTEQNQKREERLKSGARP